MPVPPTYTTMDPACGEKDIGLIGNDIGNVMNVKSWDDCACHCKNKPGCTFFSWTSSNFVAGRYYECWLKNSDAGRQYERGVFSGHVNCCVE